jgi:hypothetical protein
MKATNRIDLNVNCDAEAISMPLTADFQEISMRRTLVAVRDTLLVLGMQIVFRTMMLLRHLNY